MSIVGEKVTIMDARDPTKKGRRGEVVMETTKTLLIDSGERRITVEKEGTVLVLHDKETVVTGDELAGRLEDRLRARKK